MAEFPKLKTQAVAQYPLRWTERREAGVLRYLDGGEQRFARAKGRREWVIRLEALDEEEMGQVREFYELHRGTDIGFAFRDPWTGQLHSRCRFGERPLECEWAGEGLGGVSLWVTEDD